MMRSLLLVAMALSVAGCMHGSRPERPEGAVLATAALPMPPAKRPGGPGRRAALHMARRLPAGIIELDPALYVRAEAQARTLPQFDSRTGRFLGQAKAAAGEWEWMGPANVAGRMRTLVFDPRNAFRLLMGGVSGGVWESLDSGGQWRSMSDEAVSLNIGALAMDPVDPDVIYAGTGELYRNSERPYAAMWGQGILRSTDNGATWPQLLSTRGPDFRYVSDIVISPHDHRRLYAATNSGVWRSDDRGASFVRVLNPTDDQGGLLYEGCTDLQLLPGHAGDRLLASCASRSTDDRYWLPGSVLPPACNGPCPASIFLSEDAAAETPEWLLVLSEPGMGRTQMALAPSNPDIVYALSAGTQPGFDRTGDGQGDYENGLHAIFRSNDGGMTWEARLRNDSPDRLSTYLLSYGYGFEDGNCGQGTFIYSAGWYNMAIAVNPLNPDIVWVGGMEMYRSDDGAQTFGKASEWWPFNSTYYTHADVHAMAFHPSYAQGRRWLFVATDGGMAVTLGDAGPVRRGNHAACLGTGEPAIGWSERISGLGTTQFYTGTVSASGSVVFGGLQDNGTQLWRDGMAPLQWQFISGGDGASVAIDPRNDDVIFFSAQNVSIRRSTNGGQNWTTVTSGINDTPIFIMPFVIDRAAPDRLYAGGTRVWRTVNQGDLWQPASAVLGQGFDHRISAIDVSPVNNSRLLVGNRVGIYRSSDAVGSGPDTQLAMVSPRSGWVSSLRFDPVDADVAYATYSTFGGEHVWRSADAGATWTAIDGQGAGRLPDIAVHDIAIHPQNRERLYVATDIGVFVTLNGGQSWARENTGFANAIVERLAIAANAPGGPTLHAFTYGRGVWRVALADLEGAPGHPIAADVSGTWFDPAQDGHGWLLEAIDSDGVLALLATWYTYLDGEPVWLIGVGVADEFSVRVPLTITRGGGFPPAFDPADVVREAWGEAEFHFDSNSQGQVNWISNYPGFADGSMPLTRLILPAGGGDEADAGIAITACHSGTWYQPIEDGHGLQVQVFGEDESRQLLVVWYAYLGGEQRWFIGNGPIQGGSAVIELVSADGAQFPPAFDPDHVERRPWGELVFSALGPDSARIEWDSVQDGFGSGSLDLIRLTSMLGRECEIP